MNAKNAKKTNGGESLFSRFAPVKILWLCPCRCVRFACEWNWYGHTFRPFRRGAVSRARIFRIHRDRPQPRDLAQVAAVLRDGGLALVPTDTMYALVVQPGNRDGIERMRKIKHLVTLKYLTLLCRSLSEASVYAV